MPLPKIVTFEGIPAPEGQRGLWLRAPWKRVDFREPKKGEHYLSGAVIQAYRAPNDYPPGSHYLVIEPIAPDESA